MSTAEKNGKSIIIDIPPRAQSYEIRIERGLIGRLGEGFGHKKTLIVTDETVATLYLEAARASLEAAGVQTAALILPPGEQSKSEKNLFAIYNALLEAQISRGDAVLALGGGVVGDVAGFAAATYLRGIGLVQCPTTLLSQIDSSVGGKTAIDWNGAGEGKQGKNLIGAFYQPEKVLIDPDALNTLPPRQLAAGRAEVLKCACLGANLPLEGLWECGEETLIRGALALKAGLVAADPLDLGERRKLNFGHTLGHALEQASGYALLHGEAVALGMCGMARLGERRGVTRPGTEERIRAALLKAGLLQGANGIDFMAAAQALRRDKKGDGDVVQAVLLKEIGAPVLQSVSFALLEEMLRELIGAGT